MQEHETTNKSFVMLKTNHTIKITLITISLPGVCVPEITTYI